VCMEADRNFMSVYISFRASTFSQLFMQRLNHLKKELEGQLSQHEDMRVELTALKSEVAAAP
jgi:hypothetical protein